MALKEVDIRVCIEMMDAGHPRYEADNETGLESIQSFYSLTDTGAKKLFANPDLKGRRIITPEFKIIDTRDAATIAADRAARAKFVEVAAPVAPAVTVATPAEPVAEVVDPINAIIEDVFDNVEALENEILN